MSRPQSEIRVDLMAALVDGPGTTRELAQRTGWAIGLTREALNNMVKAGDVRKGKPVHVRGVKRPVPVYERAVRVRDALGTAHLSLHGVMAGWARWPAFATSNTEAHA